MAASAWTLAQAAFACAVQRDYDPATSGWVLPRNIQKFRVCAMLAPDRSLDSSALTETLPYGSSGGTAPDSLADVLVETLGIRGHDDPEDEPEDERGGRD
jgi:hypothetical protein